MYYTSTIPVQHWYVLVLRWYCACIMANDAKACADVAAVAEARLRQDSEHVMVDDGEAQAGRQLVGADQGNHLSTGLFCVGVAPALQAVRAATQTWRRWWSASWTTRYLVRAQAMWALGVHWNCTGTSLVIHWCCPGAVPVPHLYGTVTMLVKHQYYMASALVLHWCYNGTTLVRLWIGTLLGLL